MPVEPLLRVVDPDWLAMAWWGQSLECAIRGAGLAPLLSDRPLPDALEGIPGAATGHVVATTPGVLLDGLDGNGHGSRVVAGGPCIGDCAGGPTLEALYDTVMPLLAARRLRCPAVIFLGDREEMMGAGGEGRWPKVADRMESWIARLATGLAVDAHVVRTSRVDHERALDAAARPGRSASKDALDAAFHVGAPPAPPQDDASRAVTRRVVEAHLPAVVASHLALPRAPLVIVSENLQQAGCVRLAADLALRAGHRVELLAHLPAPSASAVQRMYRAAAWDKLPAASLADVASGRVAGLHPLTGAFFASWLDVTERERLSDLARAA